MKHHLAFVRSDTALACVKRHGRTVRVWFASNGALVGCWRGRNGRTYAIGHDVSGKVIAYRAMQPCDNWERGGNI